MSVLTAPLQTREQRAQNNGGLEIPPLESGDRLTRLEFERRYHLHPEIKKAELIEGEVYVASPVRAKQHGNPHFAVIGWLAAYQMPTPGIQGSDNATVRLDLENEPQPDALLRLEPLSGGRSQIDEDGFFQGPPELVVEVAASSASYDMNKKKRVYARNGVQEYVVFQIYERQVDWFVLRAHGYDALLPDAEGVVRSEIFPGLWLDVNAFWAGDMAKVLSVLQTGLASAEYAVFAETIKNKLNSR